MSYCPIRLIIRKIRYTLLHDIYQYNLYEVFSILSKSPSTKMYFTFNSNTRFLSPKTKVLFGDSNIKS